MKILSDGIVVITNAYRDVGYMLAKGTLPSYLTEIWEWSKVPKLERAGLNKLTDKAKKPIENGLAFVVLACVALTIGTFADGHPLIAYRGWFILGISAGFILLSWVGTCFPLFDYHEFGLWRAVKWLFELAPMKARDFPRSPQELKPFYMILMSDMARLVMELQGKHRPVTALIAKSHLAILEEGAVGFGFITDRKKTSELIYEVAAHTSDYRLLDVERWMQKYGK